MIGIAALWANPLVRKIVALLIIIAAIVFAFRWWGTRNWYKGEAQGRLYMAREIEIQKQAEWAEREADLNQMAVAVQDERIAVEEERQRVERDRSSLSRTLKSGLESIQAERSGQYESVAAVPDPALWDSIRTVSRDLSLNP